MPKFEKRPHSEYVISANANILPDAINVIVAGEDVTNYIQLKVISPLISINIQGRRNIYWPPTSKDILESNCFFDFDK